MRQQVKLDHLAVGDEVVFTEHAREQFSSRVSGLGVVLSIFRRSRAGQILIRVQRVGVKHPDTWATTFWRRT